MPRYHLNIYNSIGPAEDEDGGIYADVASARDEAVRSIWAMLAEELKQNGVIDLRGRIEIADEDGTLVDVVGYPAVVRILGAE